MRTFLLAALLLVGVTTTAAAQRTETVGAFTVVYAKDPIDDSNRSFIMTSPEGEESDAAFYWRCMSDGLNVVVGIGKYFGGDDDDEIQVITRLDSDENSGIVYWPLLQGNRAAYMPMHRVESFTSRAMSAKQLAVRAIDPLDGETLTWVYRLDGLRQALAKITPCR